MTPADSMATSVPAPMTRPTSARASAGAPLTPWPTMAMAPRFELRQGQTQSLVMTPQLQQAIKLLQMSRMELSELVQEELLENPMLEEGAEAREARGSTTVRVGGAAACSAALSATACSSNSS